MTSCNDYYMEKTRQSQWLLAGSSALAGAWIVVLIVIAIWPYQHDTEYFSGKFSELKLCDGGFGKLSSNGRDRLRLDCLDADYAVRVDNSVPASLRNWDVSARTAFAIGKLD